MALDLTQARTSVPAAPAQQKTGLAALIKSKIANTLTGKKGEQFVADVVALVRNNPALATCDQVSLVASCLQAQTLGLYLNLAMGQAWIIPFEDKKEGITKATCQIGYKGYVQLAIRSGQYRKLNVISVKAGELISWNPLEEEISIELIPDEKERAKAETIGYYAMLEYLNGFRKAMFWSKEKMQEHAKQYSQAYRNDLRKGWTNSFWSKDFDSMAIKTMLRQLISKWGIMSVEMQTALESDGKLADGSYAEGNVLDADFVPSPIPQQAVSDTPEDAMDIETDPTAAAEEYEAEPARPTRKARKQYPCPQLNEKMVPESECNDCSYKNVCTAHSSDAAA
jgi:recombination protein RecT